MAAMTPTPAEKSTWKRMVKLTRPHVAVSRVTTRPCATPRPAPAHASTPDPRFDVDPTTDD